MPRKTSKSKVGWERLTGVLLCGVSKLRRRRPADNSITLYDDLIEIGATEQEAKFLIRRAKRLGIETI